jgi:hypothetical protein
MWAVVSLRSLKSQASLIYSPEQLGAACVYWGYVTMGIEPQTPDGSTFCAFARTPSHTLESESAAGMCVCAFGGACLCDTTQLE